MEKLSRTDLRFKKLFGEESRAGSGKFAARLSAERNAYWPVIKYNFVSTIQLGLHLYEGF